MDENLNRKDQTHNVAAKLNKAFALFCKSRNYVSFNTLKTIHFATLFTYKLCKPRIITLQKKAQRIKNNQLKNSHSGPLFKKSKNSNS